MRKHTLSRRDFLKLVGLGAASALLAGCEGQRPPFSSFTPSLSPTPTKTVPPIPTSTPSPSATPEPTPTPTPAPWQIGTEIESLIPAAQIPIIEYHYPGFAAAGVQMPPDMFAAQIAFLKESGYRTVTDRELAAFLENQIVLPAKTVALRIDQGAAHFAEFEEMIAVIEEAGFSAMVYVLTGENYTEENWDKFAEWVRRGAISLGSHSVSHPDFRVISASQAAYEATTSKRDIEAQLAKRNVQAEVVSFAFPYDYVPDNVNFLKAAGYKFCLGGYLYNALTNSARPGQFLLPSLYPYVADATLKIVQANPRYHPRAVILHWGYVFDELIFRNSTPITLAAIEKVLGAPYEGMVWGNFRPLPVSPWQETYLVRPAGIVLHTDDQDGNNFQNWNTLSTYNGLLSRDTDSHLAVGLDGITQFLPMYPAFCAPTRAAAGFSSYISIEMCGRYYGDFLDPATPAEKKEVIQQITQQTVSLVKKLMLQYNIGFEKVVGHYEVSASGKTDPGEKYMNEVFRPLLKASL